MDKKITLEQYREAAKIAMTISLAVTVFTGPYVRRNKTMRLTHTAAGALLVASSIWHHSLYGSRSERTRAVPSPDATVDTADAAARPARG